MKADNYKITQYSVNSILGHVENSQIAIPEIQRPFVWKGKEVRELIDSLYEGYPIGYLIIWQNSQVRVRGFGKAGTKKILIDGQQRVTALMSALMGKEVLDDEYQSHRIQIAFNPLATTGIERFAVSSQAQVDDPQWVEDISVFFRRDFSFRKFEKEYKAANPDADISRLEESVDQLKGIVKHQVGVIELSFMLDIDVVSEIFIRINLQGKPLNQEDFAMSKISVNEQYSGDLIRNCIDYFCHLLKEPAFINILQSKEQDFMNSEYGKALSWSGQDIHSLYIPSYADVLKVVLISCFGKCKVGDLVSLLSGKNTSKGHVSKKLSQESFEKLGKGVKAFVSEKNFTGFLKALDKAGYCCSRLVYSQSVMNYCYAMYLLMDFEGLSEEKKQTLMGKWMTMVLITGHYQSAPESTVIKDCQNIMEEGFESYLKQIEELRLSGDFYGAVLPEKYTSTTTRTAPYLAYLAALCATNTYSLYSKDITMRQLCEGKTESYQVFPKAYLQKYGYKTRETYGQVANLTYISKPVKGMLKKKSPSEYEEVLKDTLTSEEIKASLDAHSIPQEIFTAEKKQIATVLGERRRLMSNTVKRYYESL